MKMPAALPISTVIPNSNGGDATKNGESTYKIRETPMGTKRKLKVIFMGMGCSGIDFARQLERTMENVTLVIYGDLNPHLGIYKLRLRLISQFDREK